MRHGRDYPSHPWRTESRDFSVQSTLSCGIILDMANEGWRVLVEDGDDLRAICKLLPLSDGGYALVAPYHAAKEGWLVKHRIDYRQEDAAIHLSEMQHFEAGDRVKLSHHWDGFVQFSGENPQKIRSGRDPVTGSPKGLALMSAPIWKPIRTGPTFGMVVWGVQDFKKITTCRSSDIIFCSKDIYYRDAAPYKWNGYHIEGWVHDSHMWNAVRGDGDNLYLSLNFPSYTAARANLEYRVLPLNTEDSDCFLAIRACRVYTDFPSSSGFNIGSPSNRRAGQHVAEALRATYPKDADIRDYSPISLDYIADDIEQNTTQ